MQIDDQSKIVWNLKKNTSGSSDFCKIQAIILKLHTNIIYRWKTFGIEFGENRSNGSYFLRFKFFENLLQIVVQTLSYRAQILCAHALILSNVAHEISWKSVAAF